MRPSLILTLLCLTAPAALAEPPHIENVVARQSASGWRFDVTLRHADTGWDDYADGWEVLAPDGARLGLRELVHPHVNEQPFTRSLGGVKIPAGVTRVTIRARTNTEGWGDEIYTLQLPR